MSKRFLAPLLLALAAWAPVHAENFGTWTSVELANSLGKTGFGMDVDLGLRTDDNLRNINRWSAGLNIHQNLNQYLRVGLGYSYLYNHKREEKEDHFKASNGQYNGYNVTHAYWRPKSRFAVDLRGKMPIGRFTLSLRERYQATIFYEKGVTREKYRGSQIIDATTGEVVDMIWSQTDANGRPLPDEVDTKIKQEKTTNYLRSRLMLDYNIRRVPITPFISYELSNSLDGGFADFAIDKRRLTIGADWKIKKGQHLSVAYVNNNGSDDDEFDARHIIDISYSIKGLFFK